MEGTMEYVVIFVASNTLLAVIIYIVVTRIWQD
jgi:hypothetical protein